MIDFPKIVATIRTEEEKIVELPSVIATIEEKENFVELPKIVANVRRETAIVGNFTTMAAKNGKDGKDGADGTPGRDGTDGYTPVKGVDYFDGKDGRDGRDGRDGYTPVKGVDYFDGRDGKDGKDGKTPVKGVDYFDGKDGKDGKNGRTPIKGVDYRDGKNGADGLPGKNGVSCTHEWNGTFLSVTSASGTTSADLKGEPGVPGKDGKDGADGYTPVKGVDYFDGKDGENGTDGNDGYTPVKGRDYWTDADKSAMVAELKQLTGIGTLYKGAWVATETTGVGQRYTETITLPAGTYVVSVVLPYDPSGTANKICIGFSAAMAIGLGNTFVDAAYGTTAMLATFSKTTDVFVYSAASVNSAKWSYLERGGIAAVKIA